MKTVYLGLGTNVGEREQNLRQALAAITAAGVTLTRQSSVYETAPMYVADQPQFWNMAVAGETQVLPRVLLARLKNIEREMGRQRVPRNGPRIIDIDILFYGKFLIEAGTELVVPHPRLTERRFVLEPLVEIAPDLRHPASRKTMKELLAALDPGGVRRIGPLVP